MNHCIDDMKLLIIQFLKLNEPIKRFGNVKYMQFSLEKKHNDILHNYCEIFDRIKLIIRIDLDLEVIHNNK